MTIPLPDISSDFVFPNESSKQVLIKEGLKPRAIHEHGYYDFFPHHRGGRAQLYSSPTWNRNRNKQSTSRSNPIPISASNSGKRDRSKQTPSGSKLTTTSAGRPRFTKRTISMGGKNNSKSDSHRQLLLPECRVLLERIDLNDMKVPIILPKTVPLNATHLLLLKTPPKVVLPSLPAPLRLVKVNNLYFSKTYLLY